MKLSKKGIDRALIRAASTAHVSNAHEAVVAVALVYEAMLSRVPHRDVGAVLAKVSELREGYHVEPRTISAAMRHLATKAGWR